MPTNMPSDNYFNNFEEISKLALQSNVPQENPVYAIQTKKINDDDDFDNIFDRLVLHY